MDHRHLLKIRSEDAISESNRNFTIKETGNLRLNIYTQKDLIDVRQVIDSLFENISEIELINCSDGMKIASFTPMKSDEYSLKVKDECLIPADTILISYPLD